MSKVVVLLLITLTCAWAQLPTGQILGTVSDPSGLTVSGAAVQVTNDATGVRDTAQTDSAGSWIVRNLPPGVYTVNVEMQGFKSAVRRGVTVASMQNVRLDISLEVGSLSQSVVVTADAALVDTRSSTSGTLIDDKRIVDLPLGGRNVLNLVQLVPGVARAATADSVSFSQQRININGNRAYSTNMQLDGGSMYYAHRGQSMMMPPPDAVQEVRVVTAGVTAEYGRGTAVISAVTRSGTNEIHGSLWNFLRNDALDARRFFDRTRAKLRYNQFGLSIGGPILKNRLFYFGSWQGLRIRQEQSATSAFPPTEAERRGDFSRSSPAPIDPLTNQPFPGGQIPTQRFDPVAVRLLDRVPLPNDPTGRLSALVAVPNSGDNVLGKFDWNAREKDRLSFRYYWDYSRGLNPFPVVVSPSSNIPGYSPSPQTQNMLALTLNHVHTWSPTFLTATRGTYSNFDYLESNSVQDTLEQLGARFPVAAGPPRLPQIVVQGRFSASPGRSNNRIGTNYDFAQDWTWQRGPHEVKWGAQVQRHGYSRLNDSASSGRFVFDGTFSRNPMADYLLGRIVSFTQNSLQQQQGFYYIPAFYVQDNWKVSRRLTLNLGLRWEIYTPWRESQGQMSAFLPGVQSSTFPGAPRGVVYQGDPDFNYNTDWLNLGPRIGFAWDVFGDGKTSLRGGYALSFDGIVAESRLDGNQPFTLDLQVTNPGPLSNPYANVSNPFPYVVDPQRARFFTPLQISTNAPYGLEAMYNHNVSLTLERQLAQNWMVQAAYVGNFGRKLLNAWQFNPAVYRPGATTRDTEARRLLGPNFGPFLAYTSDAVSSYNALQTQLVKRWSRGFTIMANYTFSRAIDDACSNEVLGDCRQQDPFDRAGSRGLSDHDRTHIAAISYVFELPFFSKSKNFAGQVLGGWRLSGVNRFQSGTAFTVFTGADASLTAVNNDRPDVIRNPVLPSDRPRQQKLDQWFDTGAFIRNQPGRYGNAGRNIIRGPRAVFFDVSLQKDFPTFESQKLEFRADFFNVINRANFNNPATNLSTPASFGRITGTGGARVIQLALRYEF